MGKPITATLVIAMIGSFLLLGCGSNNNPAAPLANFQPEIVNNADAFQFQATGTANVTTVVEYPWTNTGTRATINHSSAITKGTGNVYLFDADSIQVYGDPLAASTSGTSSVGKAGTWVVKVVLADVSGTLNFRVEKL